MHTFWCIRRTLNFLQKRDPTVPFFLNISFIDPHPPLTPPAHYYQRYIQRDLPSPVVGDWAPEFEGAEKGLDPNAWEICLDDHDMQCARAAYYGMINFIDDQIGRLIQSMGGLADCLIVFTSDHGEMLGDHNLYRKTWPYEASARVPFLIRAPANGATQQNPSAKAPSVYKTSCPLFWTLPGLRFPVSALAEVYYPSCKGIPTGCGTICMESTPVVTITVMVTTM
ncbi:Arylsulfatase [Geodia barretti]|uniref:Arylsulfatase n=1 Tax=Geodia barretti TaxID=519541 RepID=A0AA35WW80_GEOBA|nr:Arylsulfatase [Geodia barretti]